jgi:chromosome segregation ATPase
MNEFSEKVEQTSEHQKGLVETVDSHFARLDPLIFGFKEATVTLNQERQQLDQQVQGWRKNFDEMGRNIAQQLQEAGKQFLTQADQYQKRANQNATEMSAVVGQKLIESGQGILSQLQQHIKDQETLIQGRADSLSRLTESLTRNMAQMGESLQKKFENQTSGMETLQKNFSTYIGQLDGFARQFQNEMKTFTESQMKEIENLSAKSTDTLKTELTDWFRNFTQEQGRFSSDLANTFADNFNKVSQNVMGQFSQYSQKQDNDISKVIQNIKVLQDSFGNLTNQLGSSFNQISQDMGVAFGQSLQKSTELIEQVQKMSSDITATSGQSVQALSIVSTQLSALVDQQKEVTQLFNQQVAGLSTSEETQKKGVEELQKLIVDQHQLIQALSEKTKHQSGNNSGVKEVLDNINAGIESIKPSLTDLVKFLKDKNEPGLGSF